MSMALATAVAATQSTAFVASPGQAVTAQQNCAFSKIPITYTWGSPVSTEANAVRKIKTN